MNSSQITLPKHTAHFNIIIRNNLHPDFVSIQHLLRNRILGRMCSKWPAIISINHFIRHYSWEIIDFSIMKCV